MIIDNIDIQKKVFIIAEVGNNHEGSFVLAEKMIRLAAESGADAVKFQTIIPEKLISSQQAERVSQLKKFQLSYDDFKKLSQVAQDNGIIFLSTAFDIESALFLNDLVPVYKIASGDNDFFPMIEMIAKLDKPIIMSTGLMNLNEVKKSALFIKTIWKQKNINQSLALLHCVSSYPASLDSINLSAINELSKISEYIGYSDHTIGIEAATLSVAVGARIVEKHFTIDNYYSDFHDHKLSANPKDFKEMVNNIRRLEKILGTGIKSPTKKEKENKKIMRRSIVAKHDLDTGHEIQLEDLDWVRPGGGFRPGQEAQLIGKRVVAKIDCGSMIKSTHLEVS